MLEGLNIWISNNSTVLPFLHVPRQQKVNPLEALWRQLTRGSNRPTPLQLPSFPLRLSPKHLYMMHESLEYLRMFIDKSSYSRRDFSVIISVFQSFDLTIIEEWAYFMRDLFTMDFCHYTLKMNHRVHPSLR